MRLKGQNLRILTFQASDNKFYCVGMATSCTINLTANTDDSSTKDDVGGSAKPEVTSNAWSVSVESLNVVDAGALLTAMKSMTPFTLMWDETSTTNNQTTQDASYARKGQAYLNDLTLNFNDRENSAKSLQFTGTSSLEKLSTTPISLSLEDATTKDTPGTWQVQEPTGYTYDISTNALVSSGETITSSVDGMTLASLMEHYEASDILYWQIANVSGDNQRTKGSIICSGQCRITSLAINAANRQVATYDTQLSGYGDYNVAA